MLLNFYNRASAYMKSCRKVIRIDYAAPTASDWPEALNELMTIIRTADSDLALNRGLLILLQVVKELSTARMRTAQTRLQSVTPELVFLLGEIYKTKSQAWIANLSGETSTVGAMENSLLALKVRSQHASIIHLSNERRLYVD